MARDQVAVKRVEAPPCEEYAPQGNLPSQRADNLRALEKTFTDIIENLQSHTVGGASADQPL